MAKAVVPGVRMGGKKMWIVKPEPGHGIVIPRKSPVWKNRISRKIAAASSRVVPAGRMRGSRRGRHARARRGAANNRPCGNGRVNRRGMRCSPGCGGNERMRPGHGRHRSAAMLLGLPDERNCANKKEKKD